MDDFSEQELLYATLQIVNKLGNLQWNTLFTPDEQKALLANKKLQRYIADQKIDAAAQKLDVQRKSLAKKLIQLDHISELQPHALKAVYDILADPEHKDRAMIAKSILSGQIKYLEKTGESLARNDTPEELNLGEQIDGLEFVNTDEHTKD